MKLFCRIKNKRPFIDRVSHMCKLERSFLLGWFFKCCPLLHNILTTQYRHGLWWASTLVPTYLPPILYKTHALLLLSSYTNSSIPIWFPLQMGGASRDSSKLRSLDRSTMSSCKTSSSSEADDISREVKVVVVGPARTGKTSLIQRFVNDKFSDVSSISNYYH